MNKIQQENIQGTHKGYVIGFIISILLTSAAYALVVQHVLSSGFLIFTIIFLALVQLVAQLLFFLHLGHESPPGSGTHWKLVFFLSTVSIILIVVIGSLWIMANLNINMTPKDMNTYIMKNEGLQK